MAGPLRKEQNVRQGTGFQLFATVLSDVCYRIHAEVRSNGVWGPTNARHHLQDLFDRRVKQGRAFRTPALGWREFTCDYWGEPRDDWEIDEALDLDIPSMLDRVWDREHAGRYVSRFRQDVRIRKGVLVYA